MKSLILFVSSSTAISYRPPEGSNPWHNAASESTWNKPDWEVDYFVPNFGMDTDIKTTQANLKATEAKLNVTLTATKLPKPDPTDYFVPNLGMDYDIRDTQASIKETEKTLGHTWTPIEDEDGMYVVPEAAGSGAYSYQA